MPITSIIDTHFRQEQKCFDCGQTRSETGTKWHKKNQDDKIGTVCEACFDQIRRTRICVNCQKSDVSDWRLDPRPTLPDRLKEYICRPCFKQIKRQSVESQPSNSSSILPQSAISGSRQGLDLPAWVSAEPSPSSSSAAPNLSSSQLSLDQPVFFGGVSFDQLQLPLPLPADPVATIPQPIAEPSAPRKKKRTKITQVCDNCHKAKSVTGWKNLSNGKAICSACSKKSKQISDTCRKCLVTQTIHNWCAKRSPDGPLCERCYRSARPSKEMTCITCNLHKSARHWYKGPECNTCYDKKKKIAKSSV
jgi:hypothetical protein